MSELSDRFEAWVIEWCKKECPSGTLPLPAQEREIAFFAQIQRALLAAEKAANIAEVILGQVESKIEGLMVHAVEYGFRECQMGNHLDKVIERYKEIQRLAKEKAEKQNA
jgi:hypothetical protein